MKELWSDKVSAKPEIFDFLYAEHIEFTRKATMKDLQVTLAGKSMALAFEQSARQIRTNVTSSIEKTKQALALLSGTEAPVSRELIRSHFADDRHIGSDVRRILDHSKTTATADQSCTARLSGSLLYLMDILHPYLPHNYWSSSEELSSLFFEAKEHSQIKPMTKYTSRLSSLSNLQTLERTLPDIAAALASNGEQNLAYLVDRAAETVTNHIDAILLDVENTLKKDFGMSPTPPLPRGSK